MAISHPGYLHLAMQGRPTDSRPALTAVFRKARLIGKEKVTMLEYA